MTGEPRVVEGSPSTLPMMLRAALPALPGANLVPGVRKSGGTLPDLTLTRHDVPWTGRTSRRTPRSAGSRSRRPCRSPTRTCSRSGCTCAIMTDRSFPFPAIGTVHLENALTQPRPIAATERLQVTARPENLRPHAKGRLFDLVTHVHAGGELVWQETSTFLRGSARATLDARRLDQPEDALDRPEPRARRRRGGSPATSAGGTPRCPATTTRSTSTA